jgi:sec-independent protein translocase protein TatA
LYNIDIHSRKEVKHTMLGTPELIIVGIIVVVLFGATKLPQLGSGIGDAIRNFKKGISESEEIEAPKESSKKDSSKKEETQKKESD